MFLRGHHLLLSGKLLECANHSETSVPGFDDIVDVALLGGLVGIVEQILVLGLLFLTDLFLLGGILYCDEQQAPEG